MAGVYNFTSSFVLQQAYLDLQYRCWNISIGSKERHGELKNSSLSSGALTFSENARPVPQIRVSIPEYWYFKPNGLFAIKGHLAYGVFTDDHRQKDFVKGHNKYTEYVLYHSKALFVKVGNEKRFPLVFEGGLETATQFSGNSFRWNGSNYVKMHLCSMSCMRKRTSLFFGNDKMAGVSMLGYTPKSGANEKVRPRLY